MDLIILIFVWIFFSFLVASISKNKVLGYWGGFFSSLILSPVIGMIISLLSKDCQSPFCLRFGKRMKEIKEAEFKGNKSLALSKVMEIARLLQIIESNSRNPEHYYLYKVRISDKIVELGGEVPDQWKTAAL